MERKFNGPYEILNQSTVYKNRWITVQEDRVIRPGGSEGIFGVVSMVPGSSVVAVDEEQFIYLVSEYKYGIGRESLEVISGAIDGAETPLDCAKRELKEELGLSARDWQDLGCIDPFTTVVRSPNHMFLASNLAVGDARPDEGEVVRLVRMPFMQALKMVMEGTITHGASCVSILKAARHLTV